MKNYIKQWGIVLQRTNPYTPQQNGPCDRYHKSLVGEARHELFDEKLETKS